MPKGLDDRRHVVPFRLFGDELAAPGGRDAVEPSLPAGLGHPPFAADEPALLEPHERRIQGAHIELERAGRDLLQSGRNRVPCCGPSVDNVCNTIKSSVP